jgi:hypothetical protein
VLPAIIPVAVCRPAFKAVSFWPDARVTGALMPVAAFTAEFVPPETPCALKKSPLGGTTSTS